MANASYGNKTITSTATLVLSANSNRRGFQISNEDTTTTIYYGFDDSVTTSNGFPLRPNESYFNSGSPDNFRGTIYAIVSSGSIDLRYSDWGG